LQKLLLKFLSEKTFIVEEAIKFGKNSIWRVALLYLVGENIELCLPKLRLFSLRRTTDFVRSFQVALPAGVKDA